MTAASGVVHEEFHGRHFASSGGRFEMVQLWVNLPARDKMTSPSYQAITNSEIPVVTLPIGTARVIAGDLEGQTGPARTFTPLSVWDMRLDGGSLELPIADGWTTAIAVLDGLLEVEGYPDPVRAAEVGLFDRSGTSVRIQRAAGLKALVLAGEPIDEPIVGQGPFVMNTTQEIYQAIQDYRIGRMGHL